MSCRQQGEKGSRNGSASRPDGGGPTLHVMARALTASLTRRDVLGLVKKGVVAMAGIALAPLALPGTDRGSGTGGGSQSGAARIRLDIPRVIDNGSSVPLVIEVDSPMSADDHVSQVHVVAPGNPLPEVARFHFTPHSGRAGVATRIRLEAGTQVVVATATLSDGSALTARASVEVAIGGCTS